MTKDEALRELERLRKKEEARRAKIKATMQARVKAGLPTGRPKSNPLPPGRTTRKGKR